MERVIEEAALEGPLRSDERSKARLLERDPFLRELALNLDATVAGAGRTVFISGEAGVGKTSLVEHFVGGRRPSVRALWGACEALFTPRPLGPLHDIALQTGGDLLEALVSGGDRALIFLAFLKELHRHATASVVILEDIHWADEATLDFIKFLGRRIQRVKALLILTYRDDEIGADHPLRFVLGDLPSQHTTRLLLPVLSRAAVASLAIGKGRSIEDLVAVTGGNPFYVTEVVASEGREVPASVSDAVLARAARLSSPAREVLELVSLFPGQAERRVVEDILHGGGAAIEECISSGMLRSGSEALLSFRHELARLAVEAAVRAHRAKHLHSRILEVLLTHQIRETARLVHHAERAGNGEAVLKLAPEAARQAAALGAHREAASLYAAALRYADILEPDERAALLEARSYECYLTGQIDEAIQARREALGLWRQLDRTVDLGRCLRWLSRLNWFTGENDDAERLAEEAIRVLSIVPPGRELAMAFSNRAQLFMLANKKSEAIALGLRAVDLAQRMGDVETVAHAKNNVGVAQLQAGEKEGWATLEESLQLALANGWEEHAARAYTNLSCQATIQRDYERALMYLEDGITYSVERDLDSWSLYMKAWLARVRFEQGMWDEAVAESERVLDRSGIAPIARIPTQIIRGWISLRRGEPDADKLLDEVWALAGRTGELQRMGPVAAARAESAWLRGRVEQVVAIARPVFERALALEDTRISGELGYQLWLAGDMDVAPAGVEEPFALMMEGSWGTAADLWRRLGCPYEEAMALSEGDRLAQLTALEIFERLGAGPASEMLRRRMREQGVPGVPRGLRTSTRVNPYELTDRQMDVLRLLTQGLSNKEIGKQLYISPKTVDHHVSALFSKLGVSSRTEAASVALQQELFAGPGNHQGSTS